MAYFNKYTLDFGDVEGHSYRLIIQERGYTGSSSQIKGGKDPIIIRYDGDDDEFGAIYGSSATIQIYEETLNQFDDLIETGEKQHRVILKYLNPGSSTFKNYWIGFLVGDDMARTISPLPNLLKFKAFDGLSTLKGRDAYLVPRSTGNQFNKMLYHILKMLNINDDNESTTLQFWNATTYYNIDYLLNNSILSDRILTFIFSTTPYQFKNGYAIFNAKEQLINMMNTIGARIYQAQGYWMIDQNQGGLDSYILNEYRVRARDNNTGVAVSNTFNFIRNRLRNTLNYNTLWHKYGSGTGNFFSNQIESRLYIAPEKLKPLEIKEFYKPTTKQILNEVDISQFEKQQVLSNSGAEYVGSGSFPTNNFEDGWFFGGSGQTTHYRPTLGWQRGYKSNIRKQGRNSIFSNAIAEMTLSYFSDIQNFNVERGGNESGCIRNGASSNRFNIKGFNSKKMFISANVYVEMDGVPSDMTSSTGATFNQLVIPYRILLLEPNSSGNASFTDIVSGGAEYYWTSNNGQLGDENFDLAGVRTWKGSLFNYKGPGRLIVEKENYNKWVNFQAEIPNPVSRDDSEADDDFVVMIYFYEAYCFFGDAFTSNANNTNQEVFPEYKGYYLDNVQFYLEDNIETPKTFITKIDQNQGDDSETIDIKNRAFGNYVSTTATIDNFTTQKWARAQAIFGTNADEKKARAKQLPELINQDIANNHQDRQRVYEGKFKLMDPNKSPMFFSDRIWMGWGITDFNTPGNNNFSECDDNLVTINKMTFNPKANEYDITGNLNVVSQSGNGDIAVTEEIQVGDD